MKLGKLMLLLCISFVILAGCNSENKADPKQMEPKERIQLFFDEFAKAVKEEDAERFYSMQYDEFESAEQVAGWFESADLNYEVTLIEIVEETNNFITVLGNLVYEEIEGGAVESSRETEELLTLVKPGEFDYGEDNEFGMKLMID